MSREKVAPLPDRSAMTRRSPPGKTEPVRASSALVLAPHYDDEVLGCGGLVTQLASRGAVVRVLFLSDSGGAVPVAAEREAYSLRRRQEADEAAEVLALAGVDHLGLPDGNLEQHLEMLVEGMSRALLSQRPELLLVPSPLEVSADHRAAFAALHRLLGSLRHEDPLEPLMRDLRILTYEINHPQSPDLLVDISDQVKIIERAMACYGSQLEQHDYLGACLGLSKFRTLTLPSGVEAAEAYCQLICEDFQTRSLARLTAELGGVPELLPVNEGPLISVIVRTKDRPELLVEALASLAASTYRRVEVVVVNDGGQRPSVTEELPFHWRLSISRRTAVGREPQTLALPSRAVSLSPFLMTMIFSTPSISLLWQTLLGPWECGSPTPTPLWVFTSSVRERAGIVSSAVFPTVAISIENCYFLTTTFRSTLCLSSVDSSIESASSMRICRFSRIGIS